MVVRTFVIVLWALLATPLAISPASSGNIVPQLLGANGVPTLAPLVERVTPAVVSIAVMPRTAARDNPLFRDPLYRDFFGIPETIPPQQSIALGSGVVVDAQKGYVITNHHVVANAARIAVTLRDGRSTEATLVGSDQATEIALLRIEAGGLQDVPMADSDKLQVGDFVLAIGNPFGLGQTVTSGIVSALGRRGLNVRGYEDFIQTDASINPGNSGGALVNLRGELVGINTAIIGPSGGNVGIGFAVPSNIARSIMDQLIAYGEVRRGRLGIGIQDLTPEAAKALGVGSEAGAVVMAVDPGSPAQRAGLEIGDVVVAVDGRPVRDADELRNRIGLLVRGTVVVLSVLRKDRRIEIEAKIGAVDAAAAEDPAPARLAGAVLRDNADEGEPNGVAVTEVAPDSPAAQSGLRAGDRIVAFNRYPVRSVEELRRRLDQWEGAVALTIDRGGQRRLIFLR